MVIKYIFRATLFVGCVILFLIYWYAEYKFLILLLNSGYDIRPRTRKYICMLGKLLMLPET